MIFKSFILEKNVNLLKDRKIVLFYGENDGLKKDLKTKIYNVNKSAEKIYFVQDEVLKDKNLLVNEILNKSLFNKEKIFFIDQCSDKILPLIEEIENTIQNEKVYIFANVLDKKSKLRNFFEDSKANGICPCYEDTITTIKSIIINKLREYNGVTPQILNLIVENAGLDRNKVNNEIDKIYAYFQNKSIVHTKLEQLLNIKTNEDFSRLKDEALNGNKINTNNLLSDTVFNNEENFYYLNSISQRMIRLNHIDLMKKNNENVETIVSKLKPPIFWKDKPIIIQQSKKWNKKKIQKALEKIYETELKIKSDSSIRNDLLIKNLIVDLCYKANDASIN